MENKIMIHKLDQMTEHPREALFDMDGSLADYDKAMRLCMRAMRNPNEPEIGEEDDMHSLEDGNPHIKVRMDYIKSNPGWWARLPRIENGFKIVTAAKEIGFNLNILTKGPSKHSAAWKEKLDWCQSQPELKTADIHMTMNKGLVYGTFLYDDFPPYMDIWLKHRPRGLGIMPVTSYNKDYLHPNVIKWDGTNYVEVYAALEVAYNRLPYKSLVLAR